VPPLSPLRLMAGGSLYLTRPTLVDYVRERGDLERRADDLFGWIASGDLHVRVGEHFALRDAAQAHEALEARRTTGKVLLIP
jgi:NADPH2:quinone reductase